ncbi:MAG: hypothetical protein QOH52_3033 [Pseudonocardiales bacterium]|jgi:hypothetical protein|nr:hypothetical protein [Pseudonocardiales bacterium]
MWERLQTMHPRREIAERDVRVAAATIQTRRRKTITTATMIRMSTTVPSPIYMDKAFPKSRSRYLASVGRLRSRPPLASVGLLTAVHHLRRLSAETGRVAGTA